MDKDLPIPFLMGCDFIERRNVAWRVELGQPDPGNPLIEGQMPWDDGVPFQHGTVLRDPIDGLWKAWGTAAPTSTFDRRLVYYQSNDGVNWDRPELPICPFGKYSKTNILKDFDTGGTSIYANVLVFPEAAEGRRYLLYVLCRPEEPHGVENLRPVTGFAGTDGQKNCGRGVYRYHSTDGIHWQPDAGPVLVNDPDPLSANGTADGIFVYQQRSGQYVAYHKTSVDGLPGSIVPFEVSVGSSRILVRRTSEDGIVWQRHEPCLIPDWRDSSDVQFMEMSVTPMMGGYVGMVTVYHALSQTLQFQFAASRDGRSWWRPDRRPCIPVPPMGEYGGGMVWGTHHLIEDNGRMHYYYTGLEGIHGDIFATTRGQTASRNCGLSETPLTLRGEVINRSPSELAHHGALCRATWQSGRLWALITASGGDEIGMATASLQMKKGEVLNINAASVKNGNIQVELIDQNGKPIVGFTRDDCDGFSGDSIRHTVRWQGKEGSPVDGVHPRFILQRARLYGLRVTPG